MGKALCIHGHFYQPPRQDPWLGEILPEGSAAPARHWNERISAESYAPLAFARRMDGNGRIIEIMNCYEWMSFNFGPTLLNWLRGAEPLLHQRIIEADQSSLKRWGHGNALAQVYHHIILPLASPLHKELEIAWALMDFEARFGRKAEGIWLSEAAVDTPTLEALADAGLRFTILAPRQAEAIYSGGAWQPVHDSRLDIGRPYLAELPSGRELAVFFYNGEVSQDVAFQGLLRDGERFWNRLSGSSNGGLLTLATDGETYGHHFKFGEMALAYVLDQARSGRDGLRLTNPASFLDDNPPRQRVRIKDPSSWSCIHGVERWRSACGCTTGGHPGWNQEWRAPLRQAIGRLNEEIDGHFFSAGQQLFPDPKAALLDYGRVLAGSLTPYAFAASRMLPELNSTAQTRAWKLLAMEEWSLAAQASCAWFFDEISRIEPLNALTFALRAADLAGETGGPDLEPGLEEDLAPAQSNQPELGNGRDIFRNLVAPRRETLCSLVAQALFRLWAEGRMPAEEEAVEVRWDQARVSVTLHPPVDSAAPLDILTGTCQVCGPYDSGDSSNVWTWEQATGKRPLAGRVLAFSLTHPPEIGSEPWFRFQDLPWNKRQAIALRWSQAGAESLWLYKKARAIQTADLFLPRQQAQFSQNLEEEWDMLWSGIAWRHLQGLEVEAPAREFFLDFLRRIGHGHPEAQSLARRVGWELESCLEAGPGRWKEALDMVRRSRELGLPELFWRAQNHVWRHGFQDRNNWDDDLRELARELGFAAD